MSNANYFVDAGDKLVISPIELFDEEGVAVTAYNGAQDLIVTVWPGGTRAPSFTFTNGNATWLTTTPAANTCQIILTGAQTATLIPGKYDLKLQIDDAGELVKAFDCNITIEAAPGTDTQPPTYPIDPAKAYNELLKYGRSWLKQLQTSDDEAGFAEQMGRARTNLEDVIHSRYRVASMVMVVGGQAFGPRRSGARSVWLTQQLAANTLTVTDKVAEYTAKRALGYICQGQIDGDPNNKYAKLARMYHSHADALAASMVVELDTSGNGLAPVVIDLSSTDPMMG